MRFPAALLAVVAFLGVVEAAPLTFDAWAQSPPQAQRGAVALHVVQIKRVASNSAIEIILDDASAARLQKLTRDAEGSRLVFLSEGRKLVSLRIQDAIGGPAIMLSGDFNKTDFEANVRRAGSTIEVAIE